MMPVGNYGRYGYDSATFKLNYQVSIVRISILPQDDNTNGWSAILPPRQSREPLHGERKADWLVIGAGYTGLAIARALALHRPNDTIVVLEAGVVGENASGRNSGFAIDTPHNVGSSLAEFERAAQYKRLLGAGIASLENTVRENGIDCQWSRSGKYHCAVSESDAGSILEHHARELSALGEPYELLDRDQLASRLGTSYFHQGIYTPGCVLVNPAALVRGLADSLPPNVTLCERSPVTSLATGSRVIASTAGGSVTAPKLMLATNTLAPQFNAFRHRMFTAVSYGSLSAPLSAAQRERIGNIGQWGVTPASAVTGATMRYTADHRILIRQHFGYAPRVVVSQATKDRVRALHRTVFDARFPALHDVALEHFWTGFLTITRNGAPAWGRVAPNVFASAGCNGVGIVKQSIAGTLLAEYACGVDNPLIGDMQGLGQPSFVPPRPLVDIGVGLHLARERWVGRREF
jgi:glycine/D-amino acid oxidase-like deaminating enzyme